MTRTAVFLPAFALWPVLAFLGMQGFSPLIALTGLASLVILNLRLRIAFYALPAMLFVAWAVASGGWATGAGPWLAGSLGEGTLSVEAAGLRLAFVAGFSLATVALARSGPTGVLGRTAAPTAIGLHALVILVLALMLPTLLGLLGISTDPADPKNQETMQNVIRNAILLGVALPVLTAIGFARRAWPASAAALGVSLVAILACLRLEADAGALAIVFGLGGLILVTLLPKTGLSLITTGLGVLVLTAPGWVMLVVEAGQMAEARGMVPASLLSRLYAWEWVNAQVFDAPLIGHGLEAAKSWTLTYAELPAFAGDDLFLNYRVVPGHPHNMPLQIWAETGAVGAGLAALSLFALSWRWRNAGAWSREQRISAAMLAAAVTGPALVSFSVWNEAYWAAVALAATMILVRGHRPV